MSAYPSTHIITQSSTLTSRLNVSFKRSTIITCFLSYGLSVRSANDNSLPYPWMVRQWIMDTDGRKAAAVLNRGHCPRICRKGLNETTKSITKTLEFQSGMLTTILRRSVASPLLNTTLHHSQPRTRRCTALRSWIRPPPSQTFAYVSCNVISATRTVRPLHDGFPNGSGGQSLTSQRGAPGLIPGQVTWHLWWTKWPSISVSTANPHSLECSTLTCKPQLVQWGHQWPMDQVDSVSPHPTQCNQPSSLTLPVSLYLLLS